MNRRAGVLLACLLAGAGGIPAAMAASEAEERFLIMELMDRYGIVHDFGTPEEFASVFTDDAVIQSGGRQVRGRDALIALAKRDEERYWTFEGQQLRDDGDPGPQHRPEGVQHEPLRGPLPQGGRAVAHRAPHHHR